VEKRRVALSHFLFNLFTDIVAFLMLPLLLDVIQRVAAVHDPLYALVAFHSSFNFVGIVLMLPFVDSFVRLLQRLVPDRPKPPACEFIHRVPAEVTDAAIEAVRQDLRRLLAQVTGAERSGTGDTHAVALARDSAYLPLKQRTGELLAYLYLVQTAAREESDAKTIANLNHAVRNAGYAAKVIKDVQHNLEEFRESDNPGVRAMDTHLHTLADRTSLDLRQLLHLSPSGTGADAIAEAQKALRTRYEDGIARIYQTAGAGTLNGVETASLINVNRAIYLSALSVLEGIGALSDIGAAN
jgi:phosphate:Na+ symporter